MRVIEAFRRKQMAVCLEELRGGHDMTENVQSPHDISSAAKRMLASLRSRFAKLECQRINEFLQRVIGGVRGKSEEETRQLATFLDVVDKVSLQVELIQPAEMYWAGQKP